MKTLKSISAGFRKQFIPCYKEKGKEVFCGACVDRIEHYFSTEIEEILESLKGDYNCDEGGYNKRETELREKIDKILE